LSGWSSHPGGLALRSIPLLNRKALQRVLSISHFRKVKKKARSVVLDRGYQLLKALTSFRKSYANVLNEL
jgi:hypothetical protein